MTLLTKIARRPLPDIALAVEAFTLLAVFRFCLVLFPVKKIVHTLTRTPLKQPNHPDTPLLIRIRWAIEATARNSPADFVCFPQTLAGYTMLRRRHIPSTMVYGVARSPDADAKLIAHTWLTVGDHILLGGDGSSAFTVVDRWT